MHTVCTVYGIQTNLRWLDKQASIAKLDRFTCACLHVLGKKHTCQALYLSKVTRMKGQASFDMHGLFMIPISTWWGKWSTSFVVIYWLCIIIITSRSALLESHHIKDKNSSLVDTSNRQLAGKLVSGLKWMPRWNARRSHYICQTCKQQGRTRRVQITAQRYRHYFGGMRALRHEAIFASTLLLGRSEAGRRGGRGKLFTSLMKSWWSCSGIESDYSTWKTKPLECTHYCTTLFSFCLSPTCRLPLSSSFLTVLILVTWSTFSSCSRTYRSFFTWAFEI